MPLTMRRLARITEIATLAVLAIGIAGAIFGTTLFPRQATELSWMFFLALAFLVSVPLSLVSWWAKRQERGAVSVGDWLRRQFAPAATRGQRAFDLVFGELAPIVCFGLSPMIGGELNNPFFRVGVLAFVALEMLALALWHSRAPSLGARSSAFLAGVLGAGALFAGCVSVVLAPFAVVGLLVLVGALGLLPWLTFFTFLRATVRAVRAARVAEAAMLWFLSGAAGVCGSSWAVGAAVESRMTSTILAKAIAKAGDSRRPLVLAEVVNEPWDAAYVFGPYTQAKDIDAALGFSWESSVKGALSGDEGNHLLVFTSAGRVASHVALRRAHGEFCKSSLSRRIDRAAATFIVERGQWRYEVCLSGLPVVSDLSRPVTRL